jgi:hypothetical protein
MKIFDGVPAGSMFTLWTVVASNLITIIVLILAIIYIRKNVNYSWLTNMLILLVVADFATIAANFGYVFELCP